MVGDAGDQPKKLQPLQTKMKLWQFLMQLLNDDAMRHIIAWTGRGRGQFRLINPQEVSSINLNLTWNSVSPNWPVCLWRYMGKFLKLKLKMLLYGFTIDLYGLPAEQWQDTVHDSSPQSAWCTLLTCSLLSYCLKLLHLQTYMNMWHFNSDVLVNF